MSETVIVTDGPLRPKTEAMIEPVKAAMSALMKLADGLPLDVALSALLGSYVNLAAKHRATTSAAENMVKAGTAVLRHASRVASGTPPTAADPTDSAHALADSINAVVQGQPHDLVLTALLHLFEQGAAANRCCVDVSAQAATAVGKKLSELAASTGHSAAVH